jgi:hypothetical protein
MNEATSNHAVLEEKVCAMLQQASHERLADPSGWRVTNPLMLVLPVVHNDINAFLIINRDPKDRTLFTIRVTVHINGKAYHMETPTHFNGDLKWIDYAKNELTKSITAAVDGCLAQGESNLHVWSQLSAWVKGVSLV